MPVVDPLETIDVAHHHRHRRALGPAAAIGLFEPRLEHSPVGQAGQRIALRLALGQRLANRDRDLWQERVEQLNRGRLQPPRVAPETQPRE
jgi:hypothetical protein